MNTILQQVRDAETAVTAWLDLPTHTAAQRDLADALGDKLQDLDDALLRADLGNTPVTSVMCIDSCMNALAGVNTLCKNEIAFDRITTLVNAIVNQKGEQ